ADQLAQAALVVAAAAGVSLVIVDHHAPVVGADVNGDHLGVANLLLEVSVGLQAVEQGAAGSAVGRGVDYAHLDAQVEADVGGVERHVGLVHAIAGRVRVAQGHIVPGGGGQGHGQRGERRDLLRHGG